MSLGLSLPEMCSRHEAQLLEHLPDALQCAAENAEPEAHNRVGASRFVYAGDLFEIRAREDALNSDRLTIGIGPVGAHWPSLTFQRESLVVDGSGRFAVIEVQADCRLGPLLQEIASTAKSYLQHGYRYLEAHTMKELLTLEHQLNAALYVHLRANLSEELVSTVWLYSLTPDGRAMYLLDPMAVQDALSATRSVRPTAAGSPITLTALLATGWVKEEDTMARQALALDRPMRVRLQDLRYTTTPGYDLAEAGVYGPEAWIQPLVSEGQLKLFAGYPAHLQSEAQRALERLQPHLKTVVSNHANLIKWILGRRDRTSFWNADRITELLGRFFGAAASSYSN